MMKTIKLGLASAALALAVSSSAAFATTVNYSTSDIGSVTVPTANPILTTGTVFENVTGSIDNVRRNPYQTAFGADTCTTCKYTSVESNSSASYTGLGSPSGLNVMWGSPDAGTTRNVITFFNGLSSVFTITGAQVLAANSGLTEGMGFITVLISNLPLFDKVTFSDEGANAFEYAFRVSGNETPDVPLPGALILLMSGLAGMGYVGRSRAKKS